MEIIFNVTMFFVYSFIVIMFFLWGRDSYQEKIKKRSTKWQ